MTGVESWDPSVSKLTEEHRQALTRAAESHRNGHLQLTPDDQLLLRPAMQFEPQMWQTFSNGISDSEVVDWIQVLTLLERDFSGFEAGAKSPVLPLSQVLKERNALPKDLFSWIRSHSTNRFLPYGDLANRL